jgi:hypothetical protein
MARVPKAARRFRSARAAQLVAPFVGLLALAGVASCVIVDAPLLALRSIAGGLHNAQQASGIRPFFLPDGRLGAAANGGLVLERAPGGPLEWVADSFWELDEPEPTPDGRALVFSSGRDLVQAGGAHKEHVFQLYALDLASGAWQRLTRSRRAEGWPRFWPDGTELLFVRRAEYDGWSLGDPWGPGSLFAAAPDGTRERRLADGLPHPILGLALPGDGARILLGAVLADGRRAILALEPGEQEPRVWLADAYLPTRIEGSEDVLVARVLADGHDVARVDPAGRVVRVYAARASEILGLALAPDGSRLAYSELAREAGRFGEHHLWVLAEDAREPALCLTLPYRPSERFKPLDVVRPPSWWFHPERSPGSR